MSKTQRIRWMPIGTYHDDLPPWGYEAHIGHMYATIERAAGWGWEATLSGIGTYRYPVQHDGLGMSLDACKAWVRRTARQVGGAA